MHRTCPALVTATALCGATLAGIALAADGREFLAGAALEQRLAAPVDLSWTNTPAARALASLSEAQGIAILLDRRVDPDRAISLTLSGKPLRDGLARIAGQLGADYCQLGPVAYLGPTETAAALRTLAALRLDDVKVLDKSRARALLQLRASRWDDLAEPRAILDVLAEEAGVTVVDAQRIPHDLWRGGDLPPLAWIDRLTLLTAQFGLTFRLEKDGQQVRLVPIPQQPAIVRTYRAGREADALARRWAQALPSARITTAKDQVRVEGRLEDHEYVEHRLRGAPTNRTSVAAGEEVYQLTAENAALDQVVAQLASRLKLDVRWDSEAIEKAGISSEQLVTVRVKGATLDELLRAVFKDTKLAFKRDGRTVLVAPQRADP